MNIMPGYSRKADTSRGLVYGSNGSKRSVVFDGLTSLLPYPSGILANALKKGWPEISSRIILSSPRVINLTQFSVSNSGAQLLFPTSFYAVAVKKLC